MADLSFDYTASNLLCTEANNLCFDDLDSDEKTHQTNDQNLGESEPLVGFPHECGVSLDLMLEREGEHLPRDDYLRRLRSGDLHLNLRREALDWIWKAHVHWGFGEWSFCLAINYLDRFLSLPRGTAWIVQLLAVACLSLATKMVDNKAPLTVDLQVGDPKFLFEGKTIKRMELLVMNTLNWRLQASTPLSFIVYFLGKINNDQVLSSGPLIPRSIQLILTTFKGIDFLEFKPSEIAAAVAMSVSSREIQAIGIDKAMSCFLKEKKGKVMKCVELIQDLTLITGPTTICTNVLGSGGGATIPSVPHSPVGVLEAAPCLSYKSCERTVGSCPNSSHSSPDTKRRKLDRPTSSQSDEPSERERDRRGVSCF